MKTAPQLCISALALGILAAMACDDRGGDGTPGYLLSECLGCASAGEAALCVDGADNDEDGLTDCDDADCAGAHACTAIGPENIAEWCDDGLDNDGNGYTDCVDFGCVVTAACRTAQPIDENTPDACSDGLDSDWDGHIDCADYDCHGADIPFCEGSAETCSDGIDNDGNGWTDCVDFACGDHCD